MRSGREANGQVYGKKLTLGWIKLSYPGYDNMRTAPTLEQPKLLAALYPLLHEMDSLIAENLPEYHNFAFDCAMTAKRPDPDGDDLNRIADPHGHRVVQNLDPWGMTYTIRGTVFSTVEFNHNIIFKAHEDGHNVDGTLVCITTLDSYAGGRLVFPRYGYSAKLGPRDLLICDNNHELHGNLGPIAGDRYSVVAFLHDSVCNRPNQDLLQDTPAVWDCPAGKEFPRDAEYVGCRVLDRKGQAIRKGTIFGNATNPLVSHKGAVHSESEFRALAIERLKDPAFRAEARKLRGKHLLCWCVQDGPNRAEFCHARVWLDLLNGLEEQLESKDSATEKRREFEWGYYEPDFLSKDEADALFEMAKAQRRVRPTIERSGYQLRRCASTTWSVRDRFAESVPLMVELKDAPAEIVSLQRKLTDLAGKEVNYFSLQAYENERDHIGWHQHREDKCRDARVFIISLGELRSFGVDKLCRECLLCDNCNRNRCRVKAPPCSTPAKCKAAKKHRGTCGVRKNTKTILLPKHGSLIALTSEANDWYEHAVLDDKEPKGLRISINTKCIPPEDAADGYVPRELRRIGTFSQNRS